MTSQLRSTPPAARSAPLGEEPPTKRKKTSDPVNQVGRGIARSIVYFLSPKDLEAAHDPFLLTYPADTLSDEDLYTVQLTKLWNEVKIMYPAVEQWTDSVTPAAKLTCLTELNNGQKQAGTDDRSALKSVKPYLQISPDLAQTQYGFGSDLVGAMLCPVEMDWALPETQAQLRDKEFSLHSYLPTVLYDMDYRRSKLDNAQDQDEVSYLVGFGRSKQFLTACRAILLGPSSIKNDSDTSKNTKGSKAEKSGIIKFNIHLVLYIAVQLLFTLSGDSTFSATGGLLNYRQWYSEALSLLTDPEEAIEVNMMLRWLDRHCSMGKEVLSGGRKEGQQVPSMKDRAKAKRRALAARNVNA